MELEILHQGFTFHWRNAEGETVEVGFDLASGGHWYGGAELVRQHWPLETLRWEMAPYIVTDNGPTGLGNVLHPMWTTSSGAAIAVDPLLAIDVGLNAPYEVPPPREWPMGIGNSSPILFPLVDTEGEGDGRLRLRGQGELNYNLLIRDNPAGAQQSFLDTLAKPHRTPPAIMFEAPIWTTWARYKMSINQKWVLQFADEIVAHDFPHSLMEIDDKWSSGYGELEFDPVKFPNPKAMVARLHELGFLVTLWVMPFAVEGTAAFEEGRQRGYWVKNSAGEPGFFRWWQGQGVALDVTNEEAVEWYLARLRSLQARYSIDGFKFDAGEPCFLPENFRTALPITPNEYTTLWVERIAAQFPLLEVRSAYCNQHLPIVVREWDRYSTWGLDNGLQSIVTSALTLGVLGYPFILPDMIGGNGYGEHRPNKELMIRWAQANALMPAMQFSIAPWDFDEETAWLCHRAVQWHSQALPTILRLAEEATQSGYPIVRPLFWLAPDDAETYAIGDQFALGQEMIVAPVMQEGARARDLYLPAGLWRDVLRGDIVEGGRWLRGYPAGLEHLPWFEKVKT
ncbi:MAG: glycoside hydrolase [Ardenticatenales bacterium]|nr:glycoside hydrolase [Ardenticatenales bacterium]